MSTTAIAAPVGFWRSVWLATRPKTLSASLVPVLVGTLFAYEFHGKWSPLVFTLSLLGALFIQIGTNFFNDAIDFIKGADGETRLGEARATQSGWLTSQVVHRLGFGFFLLALLCGIPLVYIGGWPIVIIGLLSLLMGYLYTGGPFPLAYVGLGDLFVLIFFGWIAVGGTVYLNSGVFDLPTFILGTQVGLLGTVLISVNNIRDQREDETVGKKTFAVRLGRFSKWEVPTLFALFLTANFYWAFMGWWLVFALNLSLLLPMYRLSMDVLRTPPSRVYNQFLARSSMIHILFGALFCVGIWLQ